ncbi:hypothetical protein DVH24_036003 [Malus domestica]|uniref:Uncharacterized protein n=1 Tax=Malus domestica TaxID=3750 RepID=A0A498JQB1_MALDO|nr:hypothetical protein DVH24_036003 [Malus domestica]
MSSQPNPEAPLKRTAPSSIESTTLANGENSQSPRFSNPKGRVNHSLAASEANSRYGVRWLSIQIAPKVLHKSPLDHHSSFHCLMLEFEIHDWLFLCTTHLIPTI